jgi:copper chaperone CopZ
LASALLLNEKKQNNHNKNKMKQLFFLCLLLLTSTLSAQEESKPVLKIQTSAECNECKARIEEKLNYTKGISWAELDVPTKVCTVKFNTAKISKEEIQQIIVQLGYDADSLKADPKAYEALPSCCKANMEKAKHPN